MKCWQNGMEQFNSRVCQQAEMDRVAGLFVHLACTSSICTTADDGISGRQSANSGKI